MKKLQVVIAIFLTVGLLLGNILTALALPPQPSSFYGTVKVNGVNVADGTVVSAWIDGVSYSETTVLIYEGDTVYSLNVPGDDTDTPEIEGGVSGDTIIFHIGDLVAEQSGTWSSGTNLELNITAHVNSPPVVTEGESVAVAMSEDGSPIPFDLTLHATDVDSDPLTWSIGTSAGHGIASASGTGPSIDVGYTPSTNYNGSDVFVVQVEDGNGGVDSISVEVTIDPVNDAPMAVDDAYPTDEDIVLNVPAPGVLDNDTDVDLDTLTAVWVSDPSHGTLVLNANGSFTYTPDSFFNGPDSFTYRANDGTVDSNIATVTINVGPVNNAPVCSPVSLITDEDTPGSTLPNCTDVDGDALTYSIAGQPSNGAASVVSGQLRYTPVGDYNGSDSFGYQANDGFLDSNVAAVNVTVNPINDQPVANPQSVSTAEDTGLAITLTGSDVDEDELSFSVVSAPSHGVLSGSAPNLTYTPAADYNGADSFAFTVRDETLVSSPANVSITVTPVNDAPVCSAVDLSTEEDTPGSTLPNCTDVDGDALTYSIASQPAHGAASVVSGQLRYTPAADYNGPDSFSYKANDGYLDSNTAAVSVSVSPVNDQPIADAQSVSTAEDTSLAITLTGSDVDEDALTFDISTAPSHGSLSGSVPNLTYTPAADYSGADSFTFTVSDGSLVSDPATVSITVTPVNDDPVAVDDGYTAIEDSVLNVPAPGVLGNDIDADSDPLTAVWVSDPSHGTLVLNSDGSFTYTPDLLYSGSDSFTYRANDGTVDSNLATVTLNVSSINHAPVCSPVELITDEDVAGGVLPDCTDVDGDTLTYSIAGQPTNGTASVGSGQLRYTPAVNYNGSDSFSYRASDGSLDSNVAAVNVTVNPINDQPVANSQSVSTAEDTGLAITLTGSDVDEDALSFSVVNSPAHGTLSGSAPNLTYTPAANYNGADSFTFTASDGLLVSGLATVSITVTPVNDAPVCSPVSLTTDEDTLGSTTADCTDIDGDSLTYSIVAQPAHGTASVAGNLLRYTPTTDFNGSDSFTYRANDGSLNSSAATVSVTVNPINDAPVAASQSVTVAEDGTVAITLTGSDVDNDPLTFNDVTVPAHGTLSGAAPNLTYTPAANYNGPDSFTFTVSDGALSGGPATVSITVTPVNDEPVLSAIGDKFVDELTLLTFTAVATDIDGDDLAFSLDAGAPAGAAIDPSSGLFTWTPTEAQGPGTYPVTIRVSDESTSDFETITITVAEINSAPVAAEDVYATDVNTLLGVSTDDGVLANDTDSDNDSLSAVLVDPPEDGVLVLNSDGSFIYTPATDFIGLASFTYRAYDGQSYSEITTVEIVVAGIPVTGDNEIFIPLLLVGTGPED